MNIHFVHERIYAYVQYITYFPEVLLSLVSQRSLPRYDHPRALAFVSQTTASQTTAHRRSCPMNRVPQSLPQRAFGNGALARCTFHRRVGARLVAVVRLFAVVRLRVDLLSRLRRIPPCLRVRVPTLRASPLWRRLVQLGRVRWRAPLVGGWVPLVRHESLAGGHVPFAVWSIPLSK